MSSVGEDMRKEAVFEGMEARLAGKSRLDNPWHVHTDVYMYWRNGWDYANDHIELMRAEWEKEHGIE